MKKFNKFLLKANYPIILASQSEIRKRILLDTGLIFKQVSSGLNEKEVSKNFTYKRKANLAKKLACEKALLVSKKNYNSYVIGADQICSYKNKILSKPNNKKNAIKLLEFLLTESSQTHIVNNTFEYPIIKGVEPNKLIAQFGTNFKQDLNINVSVYSKRQPEALKIMTESGWK